MDSWPEKELRADGSYQWDFVILLFHLHINVGEIQNALSNTETFSSYLFVDKIILI